MIEAIDLTKRYGSRTAVAGVSFKVSRGEIVGLLGPNGAGKSTILRMLTCYLPATSGSARIAGLDVYRDSFEVRRRIGYMPENNPLPVEMRVRDYLKFRARLQGLRRATAKKRIDLVIEQCSLGEVTKRVIGQLSKGFRQRVGLAGALVHGPELIILDEPTIGLDPHQVRSVRKLIKELGRNHTVLVSSHILPEVEVTCTRILILYEGRMLAADTTENLQHTYVPNGQVVAEIAASRSALEECWKEMEWIEHFDVSPAEGEFHRCALTPRDGVDLRPIVFDRVRKEGWTMRELTRQKHTLEDIFVHITRPDREDSA